MVSIFQGLYKEKYNRCRQNYKLVDVEYKGEATETEEEAGRAAFSYRISCSASAAQSETQKPFLSSSVGSLKGNPIQCSSTEEKMGLAIQEISLDADESGNSFPVYQRYCSQSIRCSLTRSYMAYRECMQAYPFIPVIIDVSVCIVYLWIFCSFRH